MSFKICGRFFQFSSLRIKEAWYLSLNTGFSLSLLALGMLGYPVTICRARGEWILWVLAPSSSTSRLSPHGSWARMARRRHWTRAIVRPSPHPSPIDQTSTPRSSSCESFVSLFILLVFLLFSLFYSSMKNFKWKFCILPCRPEEL